MYHLIGTNTDGTDYRILARNMRYFDMAIRELDADPSKELPTTITGTLSPERLPMSMRQYLDEHGATYHQDPDFQGRHYHLRILEDSMMPEGMSGVITKTGGIYTIRTNANENRSEQLAGALHEFCHLWRGDFDRSMDEDIAEIETENERDLVEAARLILAEYEAKYGD